MGSRRKDSLVRIEGLIEQVRLHVDKTILNPGHSSVRKYHHEARSWIRQIREAMRHVGERTSAQWEEQLQAIEARLAEAGFSEESSGD